MRHASLFSGIGGFDLAAEWMGWENVFHCDINPFGKKVLEYYYPNSISYGDITKTDFSIHRGEIDILTGGFPCQPYSHAGKRKGKDDERHLFPQMLRAIREIQPRWVIGENVYGLVNWDGGLVFHEVQSDLEAEGYEVFPYVLPACSINAPHRRDRVFFIAYSDYASTEYSIQARRNVPTSEDDTRTSSDSNNNGFNECHGTNEINPSEGWINAFGDISESNGNGYFANSYCSINKARSYREVLGQQNRKKADGFVDVECSNKWQNFPTVSPICDGDDGISDRLDSITFSKWRNESIKAGGNAVVPQLIYVLFKTISKFEQLKSKQ